ncbi:MAG: hypothetical protein M0P72_07695 [Metallibacterium scheffleri]|jgi:hypothetical protein|uniref:hypothetical protein n=1 Tax=Metallibacterium scheffleri TaxID=993689 RepID=UPI0026E9C7A3|nr:hypothetical protein [Metallibacterium scheffleri]MCK9367014.1 hypothetical protein [Metallibacterium scheffleri]
MLDAQDFVRALPLAIVSVPLFLFGYLANRRGPIGMVHSLVDWSRVSAQGQQKAGVFVGTLLYLLGLQMLACAAWLALDAGTATTWLGLATAVPATVILLALILGVPRYAKRYPAPAAEKNERR